MSALLSSDFWNMSGYATFVWGSFASAAAVLLWNLWAPRKRRRQIIESGGDE
ncbi:MAG: heme exporter protein CcmD [Pseudomonadota bacterium]|nr:heme exporter protein CcmD [Pseudomonadota bacterium]